MTASALLLEWTDMEVRMTKLERRISALRERLGLPVCLPKKVPIEPLSVPAAAIQPLDLTALPPDVAAVFSSAEHRSAGIELLNKVGRADSPDTDMAAAGDHFFQAYLSREDARLQGSDIAHCGICLWQATLRFFRCGARANLLFTECGAPEELLLTMALKPLEFPGGILGSRLRSALEPRQIGQIIRCVEVALLCFRRSAEFGESALATYWEAIVLRGIGSFPECEKIAKGAVLDRPDVAVAGVISSIKAYLADFRALGNIAVESARGQGGWVQPIVLDSISPLCESLEHDPFLARTKSAHKRCIHVAAEGITLASRATALDAAERSRAHLSFAAQTSRAA